MVTKSASWRIIKITRFTNTIYYICVLCFHLVYFVFKMTNDTASKGLYKLYLIFG